MSCQLITPSFVWPEHRFLRSALVYMSRDGQTVGAGGRILSACAGSVAVGLIVTPLDVAKVRMQAQARPEKSSPRIGAQCIANGNGKGPRECRIFICGNGITDHTFDARDRNWRHCFEPKHRGQGMVRTLRSIYHEAGISGLYAGLPVTMLIAVPANVLYFATYESLRDALQPRIPNAGIWAPLLAGGVGRAVAVTACAPLEVVRTRVQAGFTQGDAGRSTSIASALKEILQNEGPGALFRGLESTLWRDVPFSAFYWLGVEAVRDRFLQHGVWKDSIYQSPLIALMASSIAGTAAAFITTPFDVVKTRRQVQQVASSGPRVSLWNDLVSLARSEGTASLFTGSTPRVVRVAPACSIMLGTYELTKQWLLPR